VVGYTYIDGNPATANTIDGFARHADGSVTPLPGSLFAAGGAGLGTGLASQGAIQATPDGRYLQHRYLYARLDREAARTGYIALVTAAFVTAVSQRFPDGSPLRT
jgi:hypothetical protein